METDFSILLQHFLELDKGERPCTRQALVDLAQVASPTDTFTAAEIALALDVVDMTVVRIVRLLANSTIQPVDVNLETISSETPLKFIFDEESGNVFVPSNTPSAAYPSLPEQPSLGVSGASTNHHTVYNGSRYRK